MALANLSPCPRPSRIPFQRLRKPFANLAGDNLHAWMDRGLATDCRLCGQFSDIGEWARVYREQRSERDTRGVARDLALGRLAVPALEGDRLTKVPLNVQDSSLGNASTTDPAT